MFYSNTFCNDRESFYLKCVFINFKSNDKISVLDISALF